MEPTIEEPRLLHAFFERTARAHADRVAIEVPAGTNRERRSLTYAELERRSRAIAAHVGQFVHGECVVAILLPRHSPDLFAAQLAVSMAGAAYTCVDPTFPDAHARFLLEDSRAIALLTDALGVRRARAAQFRVEHIVDLETITIRANAHGAPSWLTPATLAYVIYTSGTTGRPKGVMIEHGSIANLVSSDIDAFRLTTSDRVAQGSSAAYDSAVEETWLAFASGATLVVLDDEAARLGPDLVQWLQRERITVLCPPPTLLRASGCRDPQRELPDIRFLYVGGEALPRDIADRWAPGRWLENGYGPTECTVTVARGRIHAGAAITIGRAVRGNTAWILDQDGREVADGEAGELCISGASLARGYLNRDELTRERFPVHPKCGRIYKTGDLVRRESDGQLTCLGRIDAQVKLRGYRIELTAIEATLAAQPGVREAACTLQDADSNPLLVAFIVAVDEGNPPRFDALQAGLRTELPAYMVPSRFGSLSHLPTGISGKLDRAQLPRIDAPIADDERAVVHARNDIERRISAAFGATLGRDATASVDRDFFLDLGGDSLRAAELISTLRDDPDTAALTVRDLYECRTVEALAARCATTRGASAPSAEHSAPKRAVATVSNARAILANAIQGAFLLVELLFGATLVWASGFEVIPRGFAALGVPTFLLLAPVLAAIAFAAYVPLAVLVVAALKRILIGKYTALRTPAFSNFYVRHWIVVQSARLVPWGLIASTEFQCMALRALGARVGRRVHIHRGVAVAQGGWDLLEIGDDVTIGCDAALRSVDLEGGELVVGPLKLGDGSTLDVRAGMSAHSSLGRGAYLAALSALPAGAHVSDGERWDGVPATSDGRAPAREHVDESRAISPIAHGALLVCARLALIVAFALPSTLLFACLAWGLGAESADIDRVLSNGSWTALHVAEFALVIAFAVPLTLVVKALLLRIIGRVEPGRTSRFDPSYVRIAIKSEVVQSAGDWLSGTLLWPVWLRLAGMRIGRNAEVSTIIDVVPECVEIGDECFLADGIYLGGARLHRGVVTVGHTRIARGSFLGNHVVVIAGHRLDEGVLIGVCTVSDPARMRAHTSWFGHPAFELPRPPNNDFDRSLTHDPGWLRRVNRIAWEVARFALPIPPLWAAFAASSWLAVRYDTSAEPVASILSVACATFAVAAAAAFGVLLSKWLLLGRVRAGQHPLWSCWCSRWDFHYVMWAFWARNVLSSLEGTLFLGWYLRAMGCRIGKRVVLAGGFSQVVDPDMLHFEDGVTVHALFQAHSFEDRVLKIGRVHVRAHADVAAGVVLFFETEIGAGARVTPHSVVMKRERLLPHRVYDGCPTRLSARAVD